MKQIPEHLQAFPKMLGRWKGSMHFFNADDEVVSRSTIEVDAQWREGHWHQVNTITSQDGVVQQSTVTARFDDDAVFRLDTPRVVGVGGEACGGVIVTWSLKADPTMTFAEFVTFHGERSRTRTWHHFRAGEYIGQSLLREIRQ